MKIFGHEFVPMSQSDWDAFAGADDGSLICYPSDGTVLIYSPHAKDLSEIYEDNGATVQRRWTMVDDGA